jgi:3-hydroxyisobutyrate dehydrogenase-like beta-hydroxyacid dehydrogenase
MTLPSKNRISVIGTGNIGSAVVLRLLIAGFPVTVYNRTAERAQHLVGQGAILVKSAVEAFETSDYAILALSEGDAVLSMLSSKGVESAMSNCAILNLALMAPTEFDAAVANVSLAGGRLADGQVIGTPQAILSGESEFMLGSVERDKPAWMEILGHLGERIYDLGTPGNAVKAQNALCLSIAFVVPAIAYSAAAFRNLGLPLNVLQQLLGESRYAALPRASLAIPEMESGIYRQDNSTVSGALATMDQLTRFCTEIGIDGDIFKSLAAKYQAAIEAGHARHEYTAVFEVL